jgi:hypothetical protein
LRVTVAGADLDEIVTRRERRQRGLRAEPVRAIRFVDGGHRSGNRQCLSAPIAETRPICHGRGRDRDGDAEWESAVGISLFAVVGPRRNNIAPAPSCESGIVTRTDSLEAPFAPAGLARTRTS